MLEDPDLYDFAKGQQNKDHAHLQGNVFPEARGGNRKDMFPGSTRRHFFSELT